MENLVQRLLRDDKLNISIDGREVTIVRRNISKIIESKGGKLVLKYLLDLEVSSQDAVEEVNICIICEPAIHDADSNFTPLPEDDNVKYRCHIYGEDLEKLYNAVKNVTCIELGRVIKNLARMLERLSMLVRDGVHDPSLISNISKLFRTVERSLAYG